jgi:hypothetical protein
MNNEKKKTDEIPQVTPEQEEEYIVKYKSGPTTSTTQQGNIYNITVQIGQPQPPPPYRP